MLDLIRFMFLSLWFNLGKDDLPIGPGGAETWTWGGTVPFITRDPPGEKAV